MFIILSFVYLITAVIFGIVFLYFGTSSDLNVGVNKQLMIFYLILMIACLISALAFYQLHKMKKQIKSNEEEKMRMNLEIKNTQKNFKEFINNTNTEIKNLKRNIEELKSKENEEDTHLSEKDEANEKDE